MVLAEMAELGAFVGEGAARAGAAHKRAGLPRRRRAGGRRRSGHVWLHEPRVVSPTRSRRCRAPSARACDEAMGGCATRSTSCWSRSESDKDEHRDVLEAYRMFANSKGWMRRMEAVARGLVGRGGGRARQTARARGWSAVPTPICASGCTISTTCRTGCCAS
jgi:phosphotransferase system enzyme I (PtsP)